MKNDAKYGLNAHGTNDRLYQKNSYELQQLDNSSY